MAESSTAETESESDDDCFMKKSKSAPSLKNACRTAMFRENPEVQRLRDRAKSGGKLDPCELCVGIKAVNCNECSVL